MTKVYTFEAKRENLAKSNIQEAAIRAGYSQNTAYSIGDENLRKPEIQEAIQKRNSAN